LGELGPHLGDTPWAELSKPKRKREWLRLCLLVVRRLERLLVELKRQRRAHEMLSHSSDTGESRLGHAPASTERKTDSYMDKLKEMRRDSKNRLRRLSMCARLNHIAPPAGVKSDNPATDLKAKKRTRRNPARRLSMQATKPTAPPSASIAVTRRGRYTGDYRKFADERPLSRPLYQHPLVRKITSQKVRRVLGRPAFRLLLMRSSEVVDQEHVTKSTERTQQHTKRQELRSQRRMRLLSIRMAWYRQSQEKTSIGDDLWQRAQEEQHSAPRKDDLWAWPRLAQRQRELLADEVEAFVRGRQ
jgi:hypothetical protein